jgi:hypothetical protein
MTLTAETLRELLNYDLETGVFTWRVARSGTRGKGAIAGSIQAGRRGYRSVRIKLCGGKHLAHRLAWLYVTGEWPSEQIDHINGDSLDNRFANLRTATNAENTRNRKVHATNKLGIAGVAWRESHQRYVARICKDGVPIHLGYFNTIEDAVNARLAAAARLHGEFTAGAQ